jgi:hypothetical protein
LIYARKSAFSLLEISMEASHGLLPKVSKETPYSPASENNLLVNEKWFSRWESVA